MNIIIKSFIGMCATWTLMGCTSMADYQVLLANDGTFAAYDEQFSVNTMDYPVFALAKSESLEAPRYGVNMSHGFAGSLTPAFIPGERWQVTHDINGRYLMYAEAYDHRFCVLHASPPLPPFKKNADSVCTRNLGDLQKIHVYVRRDGSVYGWQFLKNQHLALGTEKKSWMRVENSGDWSGQPWFKCVDRCDKLDNMK